MSGLRSGTVSLSERGQAGEVALLEELERRATAGGHVVDLVVEAELGERRGAVAPADDGEAPAVGHRLGHRLRARREPRILEHAHRAVPEDRAGLTDHVDELDGRTRPDV